MPQNVLNSTKQAMQKSLDVLTDQLGQIHTGRATPGLVENVLVDYYGSKVPVKQIANISIPEARQLLVQPWDKEAVYAIDKAILSANLGFTTKPEGVAIRVLVPEVTEERRKELIKTIDSYIEKCRVTVRAHRQDAMKEIKQFEQEKVLSEDESHRWQEQIQKEVDMVNSQIEKIKDQKTEELMTI